MGRQKEEKPETELFDIETLVFDFGYNKSILAGMMEANNWGRGKKVTKQEFGRAAKAFLSSCCGGVR